MFRHLHSLPRCFSLCEPLKLCCRRAKGTPSGNLGGGFGKAPLFFPRWNVPATFLHTHPYLLLYIRREGKHSLLARLDASLQHVDMCALGMRFTQGKGKRGDFFFSPSLSLFFLLSTWPGDVDFLTPAHGNFLFLSLPPFFSFAPKSISSSF
jgi:hypothetical protein